MMAEPMKKPTAVPPMARRAVAPVPNALLRNTDSVPNTTQKPCETSVTSTTATASARPAAPRMALRNQTEWNDRWERQWATKLRDVDSPMPRRLSTTVSRARCGQCGIGHHLGGDAQRPGMESRIEARGEVAAGAAQHLGRLLVEDLRNVRLELVTHQRHRDGPPSPAGPR